MFMVLTRFRKFDKVDVSFMEVLTNTNEGKGG